MDMARVKCLVLYELENYPEQWRIQKLSEGGGGDVLFYNKKKITLKISKICHK